jgi:hypothetical protein
MEEDLEEGDDAAAAPLKAPPPPRKLVDTTVLVPFSNVDYPSGSNLLLGRRKGRRTLTYSPCERTMS